MIDISSIKKIKINNNIKMNSLFRNSFYYNITSILSILAITIVLLMRIKFTIIRISIYEKMILGICLSDLIFEIGQLISIFFYKDAFWTSINTTF